MSQVLIAINIYSYQYIKAKFNQDLICPKFALKGPHYYSKSLRNHGTFVVKNIVIIKYLLGYI